MAAARAGSALWRCSKMPVAGLEVVRLLSSLGCNCLEAFAEEVMLRGGRQSVVRVQRNIHVEFYTLGFRLARTLNP